MLMTPVFGNFNLTGFLFYNSTPSDWPLHSANKIGFFQSHVVPEIFSIWYQFSPWFSIQLTTFSLILNLFDSSFSQNLRSDWVQILLQCYTQLPKIWWCTPLLGNTSMYSTITLYYSICSKNSQHFLCTQFADYTSVFYATFSFCMNDT